MRWRCVYDTSTELWALLLVLLCVALGLRFLLSRLSDVLMSLDLVLFMSPSTFLCFLGIIGPESISICQFGLTEPGGACDG